jgi:hypothetical protein
MKLNGMSWPAYRSNDVVAAITQWPEEEKKKKKKKSKKAAKGATWRRKWLAQREKTQKLAKAES